MLRVRILCAVLLLAGVSVVVGLPQRTQQPALAAGGPVFANAGDVTAVAPGGPMTCAIDDGTLWCWGRAINGSVGDGGIVTDQYNVLSPTRVAPTAGLANSGTVSAVAAGDQHACAIEGGIVYCWGSNFSRQLGNGTFTNSSSPVKVSNHDGESFANSGVTAVSTGNVHTCAIRDGVLFCWGSSGGRGLLGNGAVSALADIPIKVPAQGSFSNAGAVTTISAGSVHSCAIEAGRVFCWGANRHSPDDTIGGHLGDGTTTSRPQPTLTLASDGFANNGTVSAVAAGRSTGNAASHTCAIEGGILYCWGTNGQGQLGLSPLAVTHATLAARVPPANGFTNTNVSTVALGREFTCAVEAGTVFCWGWNNFGQLGDGLAVNAMNRFAVPRPVTTSASGFTNTNVTSVVAGAFHVCAIEASQVYCWGLDSQGRLGDLTDGSTGKSTPMKVGVAAAGAPAPTLTAPQAAVTWTVGIAASLTLTAADFTGAPTFNIQSGSLPSGVFLNVVTGEISGIPDTAAAATSVTFQAVAGAETATVTISFTIEGAANGGGGGGGGGGAVVVSDPAASPAPVALVARGPVVVSPPTIARIPSMAAEATPLATSPGTSRAYLGGERRPVTLITGDNVVPAMPTEGDGAVWVSDAAGARLTGALRDPRTPDALISAEPTHLVSLRVDDLRLVLAGVDAEGQPTPVVDGVLRLTSGSMIAAHLSGFPTEAAGELVVMSTPQLLGEFTTDTEGAFSGQFALPETLGTGEHTVVLSVGDHLISVGITFEGQPTELPASVTTELPSTGLSAQVLVLAAFLTLLGLLSTGVRTVRISRARVR